MKDVKELSSVKSPPPEYTIELLSNYKQDLMKISTFDKQSQKKLIEILMRHFNRYINGMKECHPKSPIERILYLELMFNIEKRLHLQHKMNESFELHCAHKVYIEETKKKYELDFLLRKRVGDFVTDMAIECDGSHHQIEPYTSHDKLRDEQLKKYLGIYTYRLKGTDIYHRVGKCVRSIFQVMDILEMRHYPPRSYII